MRVAIIWNAKAGSADGLSADDAIEQVSAAVGESATLVEVRDDRDPTACAREAIAAGAQLIVAAGGDGTVSAVASELLDTGVALGVLPLGTSNSFAAALEIPDDMAGALAVLGRAERRAIDAAIVTRGNEHRVMILHCMIGLHADTVGETTTEAKQRWGVLAYIATAFKKLTSLEPFAVELTTDDHVVKCRAIQIAAANLAPVKTVLAHGASHLLGDDGRVDVTIVAGETIAETIATGVHLYRSGRDHEAATRDNVGSFSASRVDVHTDPPQAVLVDGEPFGTTPVQITTRHRVLIVVAPPAAIAEGEPIESPLDGLPGLEVRNR